jgi:hypothetical protein
MMTAAGFNNCKHKDVFFDVVFLFSCDCSSVYIDPQSEKSEGKETEIKQSDANEESIVGDSSM